MKLSRKHLLKGVVWTISAYSIGQLVRLFSNIALARLLAPELFGVMFIVNSLRTGADLISDLGLGQNIIQNSNGEKADFYNTAWSLQILRGILLWLICAAMSLPLSRFYGAPALLLIMPVAALAFVISAFTSVSPFLLQKRMQLATVNVFETAILISSSLLNVLLAFFTPTIWALVFGSLIGYSLQTVGTYFLLPGLRLRFHISKEYLNQIARFGIWIFISSMVYFFAANFDRLYLGRIVPFSQLGVYGIARNVSDLLGALVLRLGNLIVFPLIASIAHLPRRELREKFFLTRLSVLLLAAVVFSLFATTADLLVNLAYDRRYSAAGWMMPILIVGTWFSTLCSINESTLLGLGRPSYGAIANGLKFGYLLVALPISFAGYGFGGSVLAIAASDLFRYIPILLGQRREGVAFGLQDGLVTLVMIGLIGCWGWIRWRLGFGASFDGFDAAFSIK